MSGPKRAFLSRDIRNLILNSPKLSDTALDNLQEIELDFTNYTHNTQMFFFPGCSMEVSGTGIKEHPANGSTLSHYVWGRKRPETQSPSNGRHVYHFP